jgi:hypothetical protein
MPDKRERGPAMAQKRTRVFLQVERIEPKQLLSSSVIGGLAQTPVLTMGTYSSTLADVENALGTVAKTLDFSQLDASLATLSARLPYGRQQLLPVWNKDLNIFDPNIRGSGLDMQRQLLSDMRAYVQSGVTEGLFRVIGSGSNVFYPDGRSPATVEKPYVIDDRGQGAGNQCNFVIATVKNETGDELSNVRVTFTILGKTFTNDKAEPLIMANGSTRTLYLAYPDLGSSAPGLTLAIKNKSWESINSGMFEHQDYANFINSGKTGPSIVSLT